MQIPRRFQTDSSGRIVRRSHRVRQCLPAAASIAGQRMPAHTVDMSEHGVLLSTAAELATGSEMQLEIQIPARLVGRRRPVDLTVGIRVVGRSATFSATTYHCEFDQMMPGDRELLRQACGAPAAHRYVPLPHEVLAATA